MSNTLLNEVKSTLNELTNVSFKGHKYVLKVDTNEDPQKKGIKVQFIPTSYTGMSQSEQDDIAMELENKLDAGLSQVGMKVERDRQLKDKSIIAYFIFIEYIEKIIKNAISAEASK